MPCKSPYSLIFQKSHLYQCFHILYLKQKISQAHFSGIPEFLDSGRKCRTLESTRWTVDTRHWTLDSGCWRLDSGLWPMAAGLWTLDAGRRNLGSVLSTLDVGCYILDVGLWALDTIVDCFRIKSEASFWFCLIKLLKILWVQISKDLMITLAL